MDSRTNRREDERYPKYTENHGENLTSKKYPVLLGYTFVFSRPMDSLTAGLVPVVHLKRIKDESNCGSSDIVPYGLKLSLPHIFGHTPMVSRGFALFMEVKWGQFHANLTECLGGHESKPIIRSVVIYSFHGY